MKFLAGFFATALFGLPSPALVLDGTIHRIEEILER